MTSGSPRVLVGLGNSVLGDDAVGLRVAEAVGALLEARPVAGARVVSSTRGGMELMDLLSGSRYAIVVDCLAVPDAQAGRIRRLSLGDLAGCARLVGSHDIGLAEAVTLGCLLGAAMPERLEIVAVEAQVTGEIREGLSPAVAAVVQSLAEQLYDCLAAPPP